MLEQFEKYNNFKLVAILLFLAHYNVIIIEICLLKSLIIRVFFSAFIKIIIFLNIIDNLMLIFEKTYNLAIATFDSFLSFFYICITISKFNFTIFTNFNLANFTNFDFLILNMSIMNNESRSFFYNAPILNKLNFDNFSIEYFSKNCAILFDQ